MGFSLRHVLKAAVAAAPLLAAPAQGAEFSGDQIRAMFFSPQGDISYPVCRQDGRAAVYREVDTVEMLHRNGNLLAFAGKGRDGWPQITVDRGMLSSVVPVFRDFVLAHECAHLQHGHTEALTRGTDSYQHHEDEADCTAIQDMKRNGLESQDLAVIEAHNRALVQAFFPAAAARGEAERRNAHIRACYEAAPLLRLTTAAP